MVTSIYLYYIVFPDDLSTKIIWITLSKCEKKTFQTDMSKQQKRKRHGILWRFLFCCFHRKRLLMDNYFTSMFSKKGIKFILIEINLDAFIPSVRPITFSMQFSEKLYNFSLFKIDTKEWMLLGLIKCLNKWVTSLIIITPIIHREEKEETNKNYVELNFELGICFFFVDLFENSVMSVQPSFHKPRKCDSVQWYFFINDSIWFW